MIKKLLMAAAVVVMAVPAAAQGSRRSEVSKPYGVAPVTDWDRLVQRHADRAFHECNTDLAVGAVTVGYSFRLIGSLRPARRSSTPRTRRRSGTPAPEIRNRYWSPLLNEVELDEPQGGFVLFAPRCGSLFSRLRSGARATTIAQFAFQVCPSASSDRRSLCRGRYRYVGLPAGRRPLPLLTPCLDRKKGRISQDAPFSSAGPPQGSSLRLHRLFFRPSRSVVPKTRWRRGAGDERQAPFWAFTELPAPSSGGANAATPITPGTMPMMPLPTPVLAGSLS